MRGIYIRFQIVGFGPDPQNDFFVRGFQFWLFTVFVSKNDMVARIAGMRAALAAAAEDIKKRNGEGK